MVLLKRGQMKENTIPPTWLPSVALANHIVLSDVLFELFERFTLICQSMSIDTIVLLTREA